MRVYLSNYYRRQVVREENSRDGSASNQSQNEAKHPSRETPSASSAVDQDMQRKLSLLKMRKERRHPSSAQAERTGTGNSFQIFGNYVAAELRKIPNPADANKLIEKINRVMLDFAEELDTQRLDHTEGLFQKQFFFVISKCVY